MKYTVEEARSCTSSLCRRCTSKANHGVSVKAYGELPETAKINETDFEGQEGVEDTFEFGDSEAVDIDDI